MASNLTRYKEELNNLVELAEGMLLDLYPKQRKNKAAKETEPGATRKQVSFSANYQRWYTEASAVVRQLIPDRLAEFESYYRIDPKRKAVNLLTFRIQDWVTGARAVVRTSGEKYFDDETVVIMSFQTQLQILSAAAAQLDSDLLDIRTIVQADLFDSEIAAARELRSKGFIRPAGVLAGVVLERHLLEVCDRHGVAVRKKAPGLNDLSELLKANDTIDVPMWRFVQRMGDLRNLCAHNKDREPSNDEVVELVDGVERVTKSVF